MKLENAAAAFSSFMRSMSRRGLVSMIYRRTVHTNRTGNGTFRKPSSNRRNVKTLVILFNVEGKRFENGGFWKRWCLDNLVMSPNLKGCTQAFQSMVITAFSDFSGAVCMDGKHIDAFSEWKRRFQISPPAVDGASFTEWQFHWDRCAVELRKSRLIKRFSWRILRGASSRVFCWIFVQITLRGQSKDIRSFTN